MKISTLWLPLAVACSGGDGKGGGPDASTTDDSDSASVDGNPGDADTDADTDSDTDADTDSDTGGTPTTSTSTSTSTSGSTTTTTTVPISTTGGGCEVSVPPNATVVDSPAVLAGSDVAWVCRNAVGTVTGSNGAYYVDERGSLVVSGDDNVVYARAGTDLVVASGASGNTVYLEDSSDLLDESGGATTVVACSPFTFDTSAAPSPGCR